MRHALLSAIALFLPACTAFDHSEIEERLLALDRHAPLRAAGISRHPARVTLQGAPLDAEFRYVRAGPRGVGHPTVVLIHGTPGSLFTWSDLLFGGADFAGLASDFDVVALDMIGHGITATPLPDAGATFALCAEWIGAFLDTLDLRDVTLVGNSYGGEFAWQAALDRPDRVARLVLMSSSGFARRDDEWLPEEVKMREMALAKIGWRISSRERVRGALQPHFAAPVSDTHVEEVYLACANPSNWGAMIDLARDENGTRSAELAALRQPTLLLWGARDVAYPLDRFARAFADALPAARLVPLPDAGHYPQEEAPAAVARELRAFLAER